MSFEIAPTAQATKVDPEKPKFEVAPIASKSAAETLMPITTKSYDTDLQNYALPFESDVENYMATNQGKWGLLGKAAGQTVSEAVLGTIEGASYLLDFQQMVDKLKGEEEEYTNWLAEAMKDAKEKVSGDLLKVYQTKDAQGGFAPGDATWWASNTAQTIGTAISLMLPAMGLAGAAGKAAQLLKAGSGAIKLSEGLAATIGSRYAESTMEARGVFEKTYAELQKQHPEMSEEELKLEAGKAASKTWNTNWLFSATDFMQYNTLLKGFGSLAKGKVGRSVGELAKQMVSEGAEEAGQFIVAEEAYNSAINGTDYFGTGFKDRLYSYAKDPEFKASTLLGAVGGAVFTGAGQIAGKNLPDEQPDLQQILQERVKEVTKKGVEKETANYAGNTGQSQSIDNEIVRKAVLSKIGTGKIDEVKAYLENLEKTPNINNDARAEIRKHIEDVDYAKDEQAKLKSSAVPEELHTEILGRKVEQRQLARLEERLTHEVTNIKQDLIKNKQLDPELTQLKDLQLTTNAYAEFAKKNPEFAEKAKQIKDAFDGQLALTHPGVDPTKLLYTPQDKDLNLKAYHIVSSQEKQKALREELASLDSPEGITKMQESVKQKKLAEFAEGVMKVGEIDTMKKLVDQVTDPKLKERLQARIEEVQKTKRQVNQNKTVEAVNEAITSTQEDVNEIPPVGEMPPVDTQENISGDVNEMPVVNEAPEMPMDLTYEQAKKVYGPEEADKIFKRVQDEQGPEEKPQKREAKETAPKALKEVKENGSSQTFLKELASVRNENGSYSKKLDPRGVQEIQTWFDSSGNRVDPSEVFDTDSHGNLLINTPLVKVGDVVLLKVEDDFPYTLTEGWKPDPNKPEQRVINVYLKGHNKPIAQLPSTDSPHVEPQNRAALAALRTKVLAGGQLETKITSKTPGDHRQTGRNLHSIQEKLARPELLSSLDSLEYDYVPTDNGWQLGKMPHKPILGIFGLNGKLEIGVAGKMAGMTKAIRSALQEVVERVRGTSIRPGMVVTLRTSPLGQLQAVMLYQRTLNEQEKEWVKKNLIGHLKSGDVEGLRDVMSIKIEKTGVLAPKAIRRLPGNSVRVVEVATNKYELLIPASNAAKDNKWIRLTTDQAEEFLAGNPFTFMGIGADGVSKGPFHSSTISPAALGFIQEGFNRYLNNIERNIPKRHLNSEDPFTDPVTGIKYDSGFYEFVVKTDTLRTDLLGSKVQGNGRESGFSFENSTVYLDPNPNGIDIKVEDNEIVVSLPPVEAPKSSTPATSVSKVLEDFDNPLSDEGLDYLIENSEERPDEEQTRVATAPGFQLMTEKEITWFKEHIGSEFLIIAKGVDRIMSKGGIEAFGLYHNAMVRLADLGEIGTAYHEAFHFVFDNLLTKAEQEKVLKHGTEEDLAEQFRAYMLSDGQVKPKSAPVRGFFARLWASIKSLIGLKSPIERLFKNIATRKLTADERAQIGATLKESEEQTRLLPGMPNYARQEDLVMAAAHEFMTLVRQDAELKDIDYEEVLKNKKDVDAFFEAVKSRFEDDFKRIHTIKEKSTEDIRRYAAYLAMGIGVENTVEPEFEKYKGQWADVKTDLQTTTGFQTEVTKSLSKFGYTVVVKDMSNEEEDENDELKKEDEGERIHDIEHTLISPSKLLSQRIKAFLSTIPEPVIDEKGQIVYNKDGTQQTKKTIIGTPKYIDFQKTYRNLVGKLADSGSPLTRLAELSQKDPISKAVFDALSKQINEGDTRLLAEFNTKLNLVRHPYVSLVYGRNADKVSEAKVMYTDRADMTNTIVNRWREQAVRTKLVLTSSEVNMDKAEFMKRKISEAKAKIDTKTKFDDIVPLLEELLGELGIKVKPQVWQEIKGKRDAGSIIRSLLMGERSASLENFIDVALTGKDPFTDSTHVLTRLAEIEKSYVDDIRADVFLNESRKQVNSINTPSWVSELILRMKKNPDEVLAHYEQDRFFRGNAFLEVLKVQKERDALGFSLISALRRHGSKAKEFKNRTSTDSWLTRLIGYHNNGSDTAQILAGTFSDKSKQILISLPKKRGEVAKEFIKKVMMNTVRAEVSRIQRMQHLPFKIKDYSIDSKGRPGNGYKFNYIPKLNEIPGLTDSILDGTLSPEKFLEYDKQVSDVVDQFIASNYQSFLNDLRDKGIITLTKEGKPVAVEGVVPDALSTILGTFLPDFFYNDMAWRTEMSKVFHGDKAQYGDTDKYYKRGYQVVTPGIKSWNNPDKPIRLVRGIFQGIMKFNTDDYVKSLAELMGNTPEAKRTAELYKAGLKGDGINKTDAQSLCTVDAWKKIHEGMGSWTKTHQEVYDFAWSKGWTISKAIKENRQTDEQAKEWRRKATIALQPLKPFQLSEREITLNNGETILIKEQFKDSIAPLIPDFAIKHNPGEQGYSQLLQYMYDHGFDIMSADDAVKVGLYGAITDFSVPPTPEQMREVSIDDIRLPQVLPEKTKEEITMLTQFWKLIMGNVTDENLIKEYNELWGERIEQSSVDLRESLGLGEDWKLSDDKKVRARQLLKIKTVLQQELINRDLNDNYADAIQLVLKDLDNPEFTLHPGFPTVAHRFIGIMTNLFKKNVLKTKEPGYSMVNLADFGISKSDRNSNLNFIRNKDGEVVEAEIGMPVSFFSKIGLKNKDIDPGTGKIIWDNLNENQKEALQMIMVRIPTSNKSSMLPVRIAMVLPASMGSTVMVPGEGTLQMGFDFDVDKSNLIHRVLDKEGKVDKKHIDTRLFNIAWNVLTDKKFTQEMLTPLSAPRLEAKVAEYKSITDPIKGGTLISSSEEDYFLSPVVDNNMELKNKQAKAGIGIASRFNTSHAILQMLKDQIKLKEGFGVDFSIGGYKFDKLGETYDNEGNLISNNHAQLQHAELDAAKDPLLAQLGVPASLLPVVSYMTSLGVSLDLSIDFMNQPIIREWIKYYNLTGGNSQNKANVALDGKYPKVKAAIDEIVHRGLKLNLSLSDIKTGLTKPIDNNLTNQAVVLMQFKKYMSVANSMSQLNNLLSIDTFSDMTGIEALEAYRNISVELLSEESPFVISRAIFDPKLAPASAKRLASFFKYALGDAIKFTSQFSPYVSVPYTSAKLAFARAVGIQNITDKLVLNDINKFLDFYTLTINSNLNGVLDLVSPKHLVRWNYFSPSHNIWNHLQKVVDEFPVLKNNALIQGLESYQSRKDHVQMIGVVNTNSNLNKNSMRNAWWDLLSSGNEKIRILAGDLVRFSVITSGFGYNTKSFTDLIPIEFWVQNGLADRHKELLKGLQANAVKIDSEGAVRSYIRHHFAEMDEVPEATWYQPKDEEPKTDMKKADPVPGTTHLRGFTMEVNADVFSRRGRTIPQYMKHWDSFERKYRLYEADPQSKDGLIKFKEVQALGEQDAYFEVFWANGQNESYHPDNKGGTAAPFGKVGPKEIVTKPAKDYVDFPKEAHVYKNIKWGILKDLPVYGSQGVNTMRKQGTSEHFGNPFTANPALTSLIQKKDIREAVQAYKDWLTTDKYKDVEPGRKKWILSQISQGKLEGARLLYMSDKGEYYSHADALRDLANSRLSNSAPGATLSLVDESETNSVVDYNDYIPGGKTMPEITLQRLLENETNPEQRKLLEVMYKNADKLTATVETQVTPKQAGTFQAKGKESKVTANPKANVRGDEDKRRILTHELLHAFLAGIYWQPRTEEERAFARNIKRLWEKAKALDPENKQLQDPKDGPQEFIAQFGSDPAFRAKLKKAGFWATLLRQIRRLLGFKEEFDGVLDSMYTMIDTIDDLQRLPGHTFASAMKKEKQTPAARKRLDLIETILMGLKAREKRLRSFGWYKEAEELKGNIEKLEELAGLKRNQFIVNYILVVTDEVKQLEQLLASFAGKDPATLSPGLLQAVNEQLLSYDILKDVSRELYKNPGRFAPSESAAKGMLEQFSKMRDTISRLQSTNHDYIIDYVAQRIKGTSKNKDLKLEEIKDRLVVADRDISVANKLFDPMADSSDEALASLDKIVKQAFAQGDRLINAALQRIQELTEEVEYRVNPFKAGIMIRYKNVGLNKALNDYEAWLKKKGKSANTIADKFAPIINQETIQNNTNGVQFISPISAEGKRILAIKEGSEDYPLKQFYATYVLGYLKAQESIKLPSMRPGLRIPTIHRTVLEGVMRENGLKKLDVLKEGLMNSVQRRYDEAEFQAVDEDGNPQEYLPVRFVARQDGKEGRLNTREVSLDIATTVGIFMNEMYTHAELSKILPDVELYKGVLASREVTKAGGRVEGQGPLGGILTREKKVITDPEYGKVQTIQGTESQSYKLAEAFIRRVVYGQFKKDAGTISVYGKKLDVRKLSDSFMRFTGLRILFANLAIPLTNMGMGHVYMAREAVGGNLINWKNWYAGQKFYTHVLGDAIRDIGNRVKTTKFGRVYTYFNPADSNRPINDLGIDTNWMRTVGTRIGRSLTDSTEFNLSATAMGAVFDRYKATGPDGKETSLYDALEVSMDGKVTLAKGYKYKGKTSMSSEDINEIRDYTLRLYQNMNGVYNKLDSAVINETVAGSLIMFMRRWLPAGIATAYRLRYFDERLGKENEGNFVSALIVFNNIFAKNGFMDSSIKSLKTLFWMEQTDPELLLLPNELNLPQEKKDEIIELRKANMRKTLFTLYTITGMTALLMTAWDDDDDSYTRYMLARMRREMMTFISPITAWDVLRSPSVVLNSVTAINKAISSSLDATGAVLTGADVDVYEQGKYKDQEKWWADIKRVTPLSQLEQLKDLDKSTRLVLKGGMK